MKPGADDPGAEPPNAVDLSARLHVGQHESPLSLHPVANLTTLCVFVKQKFLVDQT